VAALTQVSASEASSAEAGADAQHSSVAQPEEETIAIDERRTGVERRQVVCQCRYPACSWPGWRSGCGEARRGSIMAYKRVDTQREIILGMVELFEIGPDSVARFLARWYGLPTRGPAVPTAALRLPQPLRDWYAATSRYTKPVTFHNTVPDPDDVKEIDGKLVFWVENQEVYEWGCDPEGADPLVYERAAVDGEPWHPTGVRLSAFLVTAAVFEAVLAGEHVAHADELTREERDWVLAPLRPLPIPGPTEQGQLYASDELLAFVGPNGIDEEAPASSATWWLYITAREPTHLRYALDVPSVVIP
jgi:hypothetical protein